MLPGGWVGGRGRVVRWPVWLHVSDCLYSGDAGLGWEPDRAKKTCANAEPLLCIACASNFDARSAQLSSTASCVCICHCHLVCVQQNARGWCIRAEQLGARLCMPCQRIVDRTLPALSTLIAASEPACTQRAVSVEVASGVRTTLTTRMLASPSRRDTRRARRPPHAQRGQTANTMPGSLLGKNAQRQAALPVGPPSAATRQLHSLTMESRCRERWQGRLIRAHR